ncbi:MAG TPA: hypothetical protein VFS93_05125 [Terrimesophilobacter sp.]|nr:hypothetical protein [Terrimesophilobacter sp.]
MAVAPLTPALAIGSACTSQEIKRGTCTPPPVVVAEVTPDEVILEGEVDIPRTTDPRAAGPSGPAPTMPPLTVDRPDYTVTMPVTLSDLARFRPNPGTDHMQPNRWMVVGLDTNFYARATQHVKSGTLLGRPASVRFTPVRYRWTYGDGATRTTATPGATWQVLGLHEFDATATSHVYRNPGTYYIDLTIGYAPEYRYADGTEWIPVSGVIWVPANRLVAEAAAGAKTVLVEDECTINPSGPGC